ncbi:uncharacterized protein K452DRAFT_35966 [Aplosporella prunicola CBS 121167]|uniref:Uncharacterized protein n=1 Tax=Aplosporella prunicola CBS 121167 TaxID=1176127 RepID=A0A6A6BD76_9PEZI|nr:uncharacterized protein K452DRAFT_35966 [Aplosporella prunicola CBS 121167]KAF2141174.1 hypothetical protein K452DRAFT_35966 [Aplosporella prunicola CBS 121167]
MFALSHGCSRRRVVAGRQGVDYYTLLPSGAVTRAPCSPLSSPAVSLDQQLTRFVGYLSCRPSPCARVMHCVMERPLHLPPLDHRSKTCLYNSTSVTIPLIDHRHCGGRVSALSARHPL